MLFRAIDEEEFKKCVHIRFNNISNGFNNYSNGILEAEQNISIEEAEGRIIRFFERILELNGEENSFIDFYYGQLSKEDKKRLKELLTTEDLEFINAIEHCKFEESIYFYLSKEMIPFITRLCTREVLFSTFYFTKIPCTIWGNYSIKFPCFFKDEHGMKSYIELSEECGLHII